MIIREGKTINKTEHKHNPFVEGILYITHKAMPTCTVISSAIRVRFLVSLRWLRYQWRGLSALTAGIALLIVTLIIYIIDTPPLENIDRLDVPTFGIYSDVMGLDAFIQYPDGAERTLREWTARATPGDPWTATINWTALDYGEIGLDFYESKSILIMLPPEAKLAKGVETIKSPDGSCAAWSGENGSGAATPEIYVGALETWIICTIPALGQVQAFVLEMTFEWQSSVRSSSGIGRYRDAVSLPSYPWNAPDFTHEFPDVQLPSLPPLQPLTFTLESSPDEKVVDAFPHPNGGRIGQRSWDFDYQNSSPEIEFVSQSDRDRVWVAPATDISLLLGGAALGLVTAFWRRKESR